MGELEDLRAALESVTRERDDLDRALSVRIIERDQAYEELGRMKADPQQQAEDWDLFPETMRGFKAQTDALRSENARLTAALERVREAVKDRERGAADGCGAGDVMTTPDAAARVGRYRKKPVVIEAVQYNGTFPLSFLGDERVQAGENGGLEIVTLEGVMRADVGDWIIRGIKGELYPCKPDIFEATYEPA